VTKGDRKSNLLGVVLCGGNSSRMGQDKSQLIHPSGETYLQHSCHRLAMLVETVVIMGGNQTVPGIRTLPDLVVDQGPAVGVFTALDFASVNGWEGCLVNAVDLPDLQVDHLSCLLEAWQTCPDLPCCAVASVHASGSDSIKIDAGDKTHSAPLEPLIAIYPTSVSHSIRELIRSSHRSLSRWLTEIPHTKVALPYDSVRNVNRPSDLDSPH